MVITATLLFIVAWKYGAGARLIVMRKRLGERSPASQ
jgi:hypothetical protein